MKKIIVMMVALAAITCNAGAATKPLPVTAAPTSATTTATQATTATGTATNAGNAQSITFTSPGTSTQTIEYGSDQVIKNTPSVSGPNLTTSNDTCMGSTSGSVNIAGIGIGGGSTWTDQNCKMLKNSRELWNMGMKAAAMALMCTDIANRQALELTGYVCPQSK